MDELNRCEYCHAPADTIDHVVPQSLLESVRDSGDDVLIAAIVERRRRMTVACCRECNSLAGAVFDQTLAIRRKRIAERFERRHRRRLEMPEWSPTELMELSPMLRGLVLAAIIEQELLRERLRFLRR